jgi:CheY-like chemotaxis protein
MVKKCVVLIIEDNEDFQNLYGMVEEQSGFDVERALDGREALERLEKGEPIPTIVLLDSRLPVADGDEILKAARANEMWSHVPIYMLTADLRVSKKYKDSLPDAPQPNGVIEKGAESIHQLRELFKQYEGKTDA